jgi:hypothetical protein
LESVVVHTPEDGEHTVLSRLSIAALGVYIVVIAAVLVYTQWRAVEHPGVVALEVLGFAVLVLLVVIFGALGRRRRG